MKATVDRSGRVGCGLCAQICPQVFRISGEDGTAEVFSEPAADHRQAVRKAAENCPARAIQVEE